MLKAPPSTKRHICRGKNYMSTAALIRVNMVVFFSSHQLLSLQHFSARAVFFFTVSLFFIDAKLPPKTVHCYCCTTSTHSKKNYLPSMQKVEKFAKFNLQL